MKLNATQLAARLGWFLANPGPTLDLKAGIVLIVFGVCLFNQSWIDAVPSLARDMRVVAPVWAWGSFIVGAGVFQILAVFVRNFEMLAISCMIQTGLWLGLGWIFLVRPLVVPTIVGVLCPVWAMFALARMIQIPAYNGGRQKLDAVLGADVDRVPAVHQGNPEVSRCALG